MMIPIDPFCEFIVHALFIINKSLLVFSNLNSRMGFGNKRKCHHTNGKHDNNKKKIREKTGVG